MENQEQGQPLPGSQQGNGQGSGNTSDRSDGESTAQSAVRQRTWQITLICNNCTVINIYEFPVMRRFYGYTPGVYGMDGEIISAQDWSRIGAPSDMEKSALVFCTVCKVPMLSGAPMQLDNSGFPPNISVR